MKKKIKIDVVSDVVCPWCYIGKRRLEKAMHELADEYDFEVEYHPFELNPTIPAEGFDQKAYLARKFGSEQRYSEITAHTTRTAAQEGLEMNFDKQEVSPNTRRAHLAVQLAKNNGNHLEVVEAFFKAYFTDGIDLSKNENLMAVAERAGLSRDRLEAVLNDDDALRHVTQAEQEAQKLGITGVPFYIINNRYGVSGAQAPATFVQAFREIGAEVAAQNGEACDVDEKNC